MSAKILVVDDEPDFEFLIRQMFDKKIRKEGYKFIFAENGNEAIEILKHEHDIDILITDINMPEMDGLTLISKVDELFPILKVVVVSAYGDMEKIRTAMNRGAFDFLTKPLDFEDLEITINKTIQYMQQLKEKRKLESQLRQSQKLEAIGQLAGGIAHDFNNLLMVIQGRSQLLLMNKSLDDSVIGNIEEIKRTAERATSLTKQLLAFSRKQDLNHQVLNLNKIIVDMDKMLQTLIGETVEFVTDLSDSITCIKADLGQIQQIIMNLAVNSRDAMPKGGKLTIETENVTFDKSYISQHASVPPGSYVMVAVSDTGIGIVQEKLPYIFEPFYTTKDMDKGTGLGLATVYSIIKQCGGHIIVYTQQDLGTIFKIYFPQVKEILNATDNQNNSSNPPPLPQGNETVLVVEDEDGVRNLISEVLNLSGYNVLVAKHGEEAHQLCESNKNEIKLLITDVILPKMNGYELVKSLSSKNSMMKVLYISGYSEHVMYHHGIIDSEFSFIQKPFTLHSLATKVRTILDL